MFVYARVCGKHNWTIFKREETKRGKKKRTALAVDTSYMCCIGEKSSMNLYINRKLGSLRTSLSNSRELMNGTVGECIVVQLGHMTGKTTAGQHNM